MLGNLKIEWMERWLYVDDPYRDPKEALSDAGYLDNCVGRTMVMYSNGPRSTESIAKAGNGWR